MWIDDFKTQCNEINIKTATSLLEALERKSDQEFKYSTINNLWNKRKAKLETLEKACNLLNIKCTFKLKKGH